MADLKSFPPRVLLFAFWTPLLLLVLAVAASPSTRSRETYREGLSWACVFYRQRHTYRLDVVLDPLLWRADALVTPSVLTLAAGPLRLHRMARSVDVV